MEYRPVDRDQLFLLPPSMRDWLPADHLALLVEEIVEQMDTGPLHGRARLGGVGRAPYDPDLLFGLLVYAYADGVRSSRRIEARCHTDVAYRYLCGQDVPDHTVIARFRRGHADALKHLLTEVLLVAVRLGMGRFGHLAIDGTKIAANASKQANRGADSIRGLAAQLVDESVAVDDAEDAVHASQDRGDRPPPALPDRSRRRERIAAALARVTAEQAEHDARVDAARAELAAAQARLDTIRAAHQAKIDAWRRQKALPLTERTRAYLGPRPGPVEAARPVHAAAAALAKAATRAAKTADRSPGRPVNLTDPDSRLLPTRHGFQQGYNCQLAVCDDQLITAIDIHDNPNDAGAFLPTMRQAAAVVARLAATTGRHLSIDLITADAGYDTDANLTADGPDRLIAQTRRHTTDTAARTQPTSGPPPAHTTARQAMTHRLATPDGHTAYKRRAATVEPVHGHLKDRIGLRQFLLRGTTGARTELTYAAIAHNIRKIYTHLHPAPQPA